MEQSGLVVKSEFATPWGICDLAGLQFDESNVLRRLELKQTKAVSSITRAAVFLALPNAESRTSISFDSLVTSCEGFPADLLQMEINRLVSDRFVVRCSLGRLQKAGDWYPIHRRLIAVELKLNRIDEVLIQALNNLEFATESYAALPAEIAERTVRKRERWQRFFDEGVGLLRVTQRTCKVLVPSTRTSSGVSAALNCYCAEKFWKTRLRGN